mmetsp:Transcript_47262/g.133274  ORF Transcript_47262/g.133274 Transcript_47262/m.133274 type:complete len:302 (+) Transcript_47262:1421-2326(+)
MSSSRRFSRCCLFDSFGLASSAPSRPEDANAFSSECPLLSPSWPSSSSCSHMPSESTMMSSASLSEPPPAAGLSLPSAARAALNSSVACANWAARFALASDWLSSSAALSLSESSSPSASSFGPSESRIDAQRLATVSSGANSPSSRHAVCAASFTRPLALTKSSAAMRGTAWRTSARHFSAFARCLGVSWIGCAASLSRTSISSFSCSLIAPSSSSSSIPRSAKIMQSGREHRAFRCLFDRVALASSSPSTSPQSFTHRRLSAESSSASGFTGRSPAPRTFFFGDCLGDDMPDCGASFST